MNGDSPVSFEEFQRCASIHNKRKREAAVIPYLIVVGVFFGLSFSGCATLEYAMMRELFAQALQPALPGETAHWSVDLFSAISLCFVFAFHLAAKRNPSALPVRLVWGYVPYLCLVYTIGAGLAFAGILGDGAQMLIAQALDIGNTLFADGGDAARGDVIRRMIAAFPLAWAFASAGLGVVLLFTSHDSAHAN